ncbi:hypothetical protein [Haloarchaeobius iranensis]|uniref:Uncharacterized protein n=1 Tax=Haloarchaeobius iranensis TaxID=996166 RepID=A0A1H0BNT4_9EURY|nr:hypothetical protein [Haloarchaeobius iranensis]SDN47327.1 hypothetical protein SAMN05192554_1457 [Haloarchaeobius iranensis]
MYVDTSDDDGATTLTWENECESVSVTLPGVVHASYSAKNSVVVTASAAGTVRILEPDGTERDPFESTLPEACAIYTLAPSIVGELRVTMVVAHDPPYRGETLWQHEIHVERGDVGGPVAKWR